MVMTTYTQTLKYHRLEDKEENKYFANINLQELSIFKLYREYLMAYQSISMHRLA